MGYRLARHPLAIPLAMTTSAYSRLYDRVDSGTHGRFMFLIRQISRPTSGPPRLSCCHQRAQPPAGVENCRGCLPQAKAWKKLGVGAY